VYRNGRESDSEYVLSILNHDDMIVDAYCSDTTKPFRRRQVCNTFKKRGNNISLCSQYNPKREGVKMDNKISPRDLCYSCKQLKFPMKFQGEAWTLSMFLNSRGYANDSSSGRSQANESILYVLKQCGGCSKCIAIVERL